MAYNRNSAIQRGTFLVEYDTTIIGAPQVVEYCSITIISPYSNISFEELRLIDYMKNGLEIPDSTFRTSLVAASVPNACVQCHTPFSAASLVKGSNPYTGRAITFRIGKDEPRDFVVHEDLVVARSEFIRTSLKKEWEESKDRVICLPEDDINCFEVYQQWIYSGSIFLHRISDAPETEKQYEVLVEAYLLGEKLLDSDFKDALIDCIIHKRRATQTFDARLTNLMYDNTPTHSPLRRLWLDIYVWCGRAEWLDERALDDFIHPEFAVELNRAQVILKGFKDDHPPFQGSSCVYHELHRGKCYRASDRLQLR